MARRALIPTIFDEFDDWKDVFSLDFPKKWDTPSGISLYENENEVIAEAHVPGVHPENIQVTFEKGILLINAETKQNQEQDKEGHKYHMRASSSFSYRIPLPNHIDEGAAPKAVCKDGILKVAFQKSKAAKSQKIEVKTE